jgi:hypothetical protein
MTLSAIISKHHELRIHNLGMSAVYRIAADEGVTPSTVIGLLSTKPFTPSQPEVSPHAPAADTPATQAAGETTDGGEASSSLPSSPSVDPSPEPQPDPSAVQADAAPLRDVTSPAESDAAEISAPIPAGRTPWGKAPERFAAIVANREPMTVKEVAEALGYKTVSAVRRMGEQIGYEFRKVKPDEFSAAVKAGQERAGVVKPAMSNPARTQTDRLRECHEANPTWPASKIAEVTGVPRANVRGLARWAKLNIPSEDDYLRTIGELPPLPEPEPTPDPVPEHVPAPDPVPQPELAVVTPPPESRRLAPSTRFYVRDELDRYLHQSLERSPTDTGPLMTINRKWAWFDTEQRFKGAAKRWPEIEGFRKEVPQK